MTYCTTWDLAIIFGTISLSDTVRVLRRKDRYFGIRYMTNYTRIAEQVIYSSNLNLAMAGKFGNGFVVSMMIGVAPKLSFLS